MNRKLMAVLSVSVLLSACGDDGLDDLRRFVENEHKDKKPRIEELPPPKPVEAYAYAASNLADPFAAFNLRLQQGKGPAGGRGPHDTRRKEPLEAFPLDALKMVGTLSRGKQYWAVIQAPDGTVHRTKVGDHMGQNFGMITKISEDKISLVELVQGALGEWVERESNVALSE